MELSADIQLEGQDEATPALLACVSQVKSSSYSGVQQQGYSATILLRHKDKVERVSSLTSGLDVLKLCLLFGESKKKGGFQLTLNANKLQIQNINPDNQPK